MNRAKIISVLLLILVGVAGFAIWKTRPVSSAMRLDLTGTPGLKVAGTVIVDGVTQNFTGVLPTNIVVTAKTMDYTIRMQEALGELHGQLTVANGIYGSSGTANDFTGVKGSYHHTWFSKGGGFTTARKGE
jgi:hypothetical protein